MAVLTLNAWDKYYLLSGQQVTSTITFGTELERGSYYIDTYDRDAFLRGDAVAIYLATASNKADFISATKTTYRKTEAIPTPPKVLGLYQAIVINNQYIGRVICNNQVIWQSAIQDQLTKKEVRVHGDLGIRATSNTILLYVLATDIDTIIQDTQNVAAVYLNAVKVSNQATIDFTKISGYYLITIRHVTNIGDITNFASNTLTLVF